MKKYLYAAAFVLSALACTPATAEEKGYTYANPEGEYSVLLPEAPTAVTIWADDKTKPVPYLDSPPKYGAIGEVATFKRVDVDTGDTFEVNITFLKADRDFLLSMTKERMEQTLEKEYENQTLDSKKLSYSAGTDTLKWATIAGFAVDENNNLHYHSAHYLTGLESIMMIKTRYNVENKTYQKYYEDLASSIKFTGK